MSDKSEEEDCWFSVLSQQKGGFTIFPPFSQSTVEVIETQGQRSRQLRMRECMHSFKACHINDTSEQFQKGLKKEKLKPYPQPSRSEILANQERRRNRSGKRGNMGRWVDCGVSTYRHYNILRHLATECVLLQRSELFFFCFVFFFKSCNNKLRLVCILVSGRVLNLSAGLCREDNIARYKKR